MKNLFLVILIAQCFIGFSQNLKVDSTFIKGKKHLVYPYRFEWEESYTGKDYYINDNIPPVFDSLPSGDYLMYFGIHPKKTFSKKKQVGARFSVSKGSINSKVVFYNLNNIIIEECDFKNGLRHGERKRFFRKHPEILSSIQHYEEGILKGFSQSFFENGILASEYTLCEGTSERQCVVGTSKENYPNGKTKIFFTSETPVQIVNSIVSLYLLEEFVSIPEEISGYTPVQHPYYVYHSNGNLLGKFISTNTMIDKMIYGSNNAVDFDTLFNPSGKIAVLKIKMSDTLDVPRFRYDCFNNNGQLCAQQFYVIHNSTAKLLRIDQLNSKGKFYTSFLDYQFLRYDYKNINDNKLILLALSNSEKSWDSTFVSPKFPERRLYKYNKASGSKRNFTILKNNFLFQVVDTFQYQQLKVISFASKDTFYSEVFFDLNRALPYDVLDLELNYENMLPFINAIDSVQIYYKNNPFNGRIHFITNENKGLISMSKHKLLIDIGYKEDIYNWGKDFCTLRVKKGRISKITQANIVEDEYRFSMETPIKNNVIHGIQYGYDYTINPFSPKRKRITFKHPYENGYLHGESVNFRYGNLEYKTRYNHGKATDTSFYYYSDGGIDFISVYGRNGGIEKTIMYHPNGKIYSEENYFDSQYHGIKYRLDENGDTLEKMYFIKGNLEGWMMSRGATPDNPYSYVAWFENKQMKIYDQKDESGTLRVKIRADSSYINFAPYYFDFLNNQWRRNNLFTGRIEVFHPNGRICFKGHTICGVEKKLHLRRMKKVGIWTYYNSMERKIIEIDYGKGVYLNFLMNYELDSTFAISYKEYYDNGQPKYLGTLLAEEEVNDCSSDIILSHFHIKCDYYFSPNGDTLVNHGTGALKRYYSDGALYYEVDLKNHLMNGWYKEYNREGKLTIAGKFINGKKQGRWLYGDLTGINYLDENCFISDKEKAAEFEDKKMDIGIEERFYNNDLLINTVHHNFTRSK